MYKMLNIYEVAERFNRSASWLYQNHKKLHAKQGFPLPHKFNGYNVQWCDEEVQLWFDSQIKPEFKTNDNKTGVCYESLLAANANLL